MADAKISALTTASALAGTEVLPIVQSGSTKKVATDDLTVKNVRSNATTGLLQIAGPTAGTTRTMTVPDANFTVARTDASQSFTGGQTFNNGLLADFVNGVRIVNGATVLGQLNYSGALLLNRLAGTSFAIQQNGNGEMTFTTDGNIQVGSATGAKPKFFLYANNSAGSATGDSALHVRQDGTNHIQTWAGTGGNIRGYWESSGDLVIDDTNIRFATAGKGIDFSATGQATGMTSELLSDYEEGTWTPTVEGSTTAGTQTYTWQYGKYTKVGNKVTVNFSVRVASTVSMAGNVRIGGLPFTGIAGQIYAGGSAINAWGNLTNNSYVFMSGVVPAGAAYLDLTAATAATTSTGSVDVNSITGGSFIDGTITYFV